MYEEITVDRSLLFIQQHHVDAFISVAKKMNEFDYLLEEGALCREEAWNVAFNTWLLLLPNSCNIIQSVEKSFFYSANSIIINAFLSDPNFQNIKNRPDATDELFYIASLLLASGFNKWFLYLMEKYDLLYISDSSKKYFDAHKGTEEEIQSFIEKQALFVKAAVKELNCTNSFEKMLKRSCDDAYFLYVKYVNNPQKA